MSHKHFFPPSPREPLDFVLTIDALLLTLIQLGLYDAKTYMSDVTASAIKMYYERVTGERL